MQKLIALSRNKLHQWLEATQFRLARTDALIPLAFFGLVTGFLVGGVIVIFRLLVESTQDALLPGTGSENYEDLSSLLHFLFPVIASILLALVFYKWSKGIRVLGVARVMERMAYHQGHFTLRGFFLQFFGAAIAIIGGHSVGREGPHVHLGASAASLFGQSLKLPNNSIRTLVASGSAAGIAASFNTPLAGVIFALEVIMMEYTLHSFIPVMLAAVMATALSNAVLGSDPAFVTPVLESFKFIELPVVLFLGVVVGACAALFNHTLNFIAVKTQPIEIWWRILLAGFIVGLIALIQPEVLGIGYDSVNMTLLGQFAIGSMLLLTFFKLLATSVSVGLGVPGGMIGPALFIGATLGGAIGFMADQLYGSQGSHIAFYALLGMGAMMGASLQAPLAALTAIMELTYNPGIIMPGMLVIVLAQLTASEVFSKQSLFVSMLRSNGLDYSTHPVSQVLHSVGVASVLDNKFVRHSPIISSEDAHSLIESKNNWIIINNDDGDISSLMPITELAKYLQTDHSELNDELDHQTQDEHHEIEINLLEMPAKRLQLSPISLQANLMQAHEYFEEGEEALYVVFQKTKADADSRIYGILTRDDVDAAYLPKKVRSK